MVITQQFKDQAGQVSMSMRQKILHYLLYGLGILGFGVSYYLAGEIGLLIDTGYPGVTPFWPPSGLAMAVLLLAGVRYWPGIVLGIGLLAWQVEIPAGVAVLAMLGQVLEGLIGWSLLQRFCPRLDCRRVQQIVNFSLIAFTAPLVSSLLGSLAMAASRVNDWSEFGFVWSMWWLGDSVGILLIVPLVLVWKPLLHWWFTDRQQQNISSELIADYLYLIQPGRLWRFSLSLLALALISVYSFSPYFINMSGRLALFYLVMPATLLVVISFEQLGATLAALMVSSILLFFYQPDLGPLSIELGKGNLIIVIAFISITTITALVVAAVFSERRQAEKTLRESHNRLKESELRLRQISENINEVFWLSDLRNDRVIYVSPSFQEVWGRTCEYACTNPDGWLSSIHPDDKQQVLSRYETFKKTGKFDEEYRIVRPDNSIRWIRDKGFHVYDDSGRLYRLAGIAEDITDKKLAESDKLQRQEELARLSRYISVGELGTSMAHEINQPLTSIMCFAKGALNRLDKDQMSEADIRELFHKLNNEAERAGKIINKLRDFVNRKEIKFSSVDVNQVINDSLHLLENKLKMHDIKLRCEFAESLPLVLVDNVLTQQVIINLLLNAIEAMHDVEAVRILAIRTELTNGRVRISIQDSGCGIPCDLRQEVFTPLFTTKPHGIGLGLPIARTIIEAMGGDLHGAPAPGQGYVFSFELPQVSDRAR